MGNQGSMNSEDGPGFADANADNIIRGPYMSLCTFYRAPTQMCSKPSRDFCSTDATFSCSARYIIYRTCIFVRVK